MNYDEIVKTACARWSDYICESNCDLRHTKTIALLLENQFLYDGLGNNNLSDIDSSKVITFFFNNFFAKNLVGVQVLVNHEINFAYENNGKIEQTKETFFANSKKLESHCKNEWAHAPYVIGKSMAQQIDQEIINDLLNCADRVSCDFSTASDIIKEKTGHEANWIVIPFLGATTYPLNAENIKEIDRKWNVYHVPFVTNLDKDFDYLIGFKGSEIQTGYVYGPYIPLVQTPTVLDQNDLCLKQGLRTRYTKHLINKDYYLKIKIK